MYYLTNTTTGKIEAKSYLKSKIQFAAHVYANTDGFEGYIFKNVTVANKMKREVIATIKDGQALTWNGNDFLATFDHS